MARNGWALPSPGAPGTVARRLSLETDLRDLARRLLALESGHVARSRLSFTGLEATVDYMTVAVQAGEKLMEQEPLRIVTDSEGYANVPHGLGAVPRIVTLSLHPWENPTDVCSRARLAVMGTDAETIRVRVWNAEDREPWGGLALALKDPGVVA